MKPLQNIGFQQRSLNPVTRPINIAHREQNLRKVTCKTNLTSLGRDVLWHVSSMFSFYFSFVYLAFMAPRLILWYWMYHFLVHFCFLNYFRILLQTKSGFFLIFLSVLQTLGREFRWLVGRRTGELLGWWLSCFWLSRYFLLHVDMNSCSQRVFVSQRFF